MTNTNNLTLIGAAMLSTQRVEFLTHGIVSHFKTIKSTKEFKGLTPEIFLNNNEENRKFRKQTLGQIFRILKYEPSLSLERELNEYLSKRNLLIHGLWRKYYSNDSGNANETLIRTFCLEFISVSERLERFYKGFLYAMAKNISKTNKIEIPEGFRKLESSFGYFIDCLNDGKLK